MATMFSSICRECESSLPFSSPLSLPPVVLALYTRCSRLWHCARHFNSISSNLTTFNEDSEILFDRRFESFTLSRKDVSWEHVMQYSFDQHGTMESSTDCGD
ncbi:uncharacterized protein LOC124342902 [Daphnia pulicaria]|uniref:uncharacterized protein LOC124342902 n=1 Tax=Daphnia pulicaria TaxID=35523 RepID=UPI001EEB3118|nr:uncharacterized protein LOC124342902 [Daphnia pulicaria]